MGILRAIGAVISKAASLVSKVGKAASKVKSKASKGTLLKKVIKDKVGKTEAASTLKKLSPEIEIGVEGNKKTIDVMQTLNKASKGAKKALGSEPMQESEVMKIIPLDLPSIPTVEESNTDYDSILEELMNYLYYEAMDAIQDENRDSQLSSFIQVRTLINKAKETNSTEDIIRKLKIWHSSYREELRRLVCATYDTEYNTSYVDGHYIGYDDPVGRERRSAELNRLSTLLNTPLSKDYFYNVQR